MVTDLYVSKRNHLEVGGVSYVLNGMVYTIPGSRVDLPPNNCLFASRVDLIVYDPGLEQHRVVQGEPAFWRPQVPEADSNMMLAMVRAPSRWRRLCSAAWRLITSLIGRVWGD